MSINFRRPFELYRYFPFGTATAITICEAARALLDPHRICGYAYAGEDRILASLLDLSRPGFYVDIGCNDPIKSSNTASLYARGWCGLVVDGNQDLIRAFRQIRPRDTAICAVVSNQETQLTFAITDNDQLSTVSQEFAQRLEESGIKKRIAVNTVKLQTLLEKHNAPGNFGLLSVDVEGHDYEVLTSFDIDAFRPRVIIAEMHGFQPGGHNDDRVCNFLLEQGYRLKSYTIWNGVFVDARGPG